MGDFVRRHRRSYEHCPACGDKEVQEVLDTMGLPRNIQYAVVALAATIKGGSYSHRLWLAYHELRSHFADLLFRRAGY